MVQQRDNMAWRGMTMCDDVTTDGMTMQSMIRQERTVWRYNMKPVLRRHTRQYNGTMWRRDNGQYDNAIDDMTGCCSNRHTAVRWETTQQAIWWRVWQRGWWSIMVEVEANLSFICRIQSSLLYVTQLLTAMQSLQCCRNCMQSLQCRCDCMRLHAMLLWSLQKKNLCLRLSEFLKIHREREAGLKVCPKCFFTTTVNRFISLFFCLSQKKEIRNGTHFTQQTCFFLTAFDFYWLSS